MDLMPFSVKGTVRFTMIKSYGSFFQMPPTFDANTITSWKNV